MVCGLSYACIMLRLPNSIPSGSILQPQKALSQARFCTKQVTVCSSSYSVVIQFLSGVFPLAEMAGFTPFLLLFLALRPSTCLVSEHPPSSNQSSLSPLPLASSRSSSVVLAFSCQSLQDSLILEASTRYVSVDLTSQIACIGHKN